MEEKRKLVMYFKNEDDKLISITVDEPKESLTEEEIKTAMELIIAKDIFKKDTFSLTTASEAKIINTETTEYDLIVE